MRCLISSRLKAVRRATFLAGSVLICTYATSSGAPQEGRDSAPISGDLALLAKEYRFRPEGAVDYSNLKLFASGTPVEIVERDGNKYRVKPDGMRPIWVERSSLIESGIQPKRPLITPDEIRARAAQRQREAAIERAERDRENLARPREIRPPSPLASQEEKEAYRARQVMQVIERGEATVAELPEDYGGRPTGNSSRAAAARKAWDRNQAIQMENRLIKEGKITEAAALRQMRLQQEGNESLEKLANETERLRRELERIERERRLRGYY